MTKKATTSNDAADKVVSENGTELSRNVILKWQEDRKVDWH
jgi:hypothetical protein